VDSHYQLCKKGVKTARSELAYHYNEAFDAVTHLIITATIHAMLFAVV
jgi:hypothetical protein